MKQAIQQLKIEKWNTWYPIQFDQEAPYVFLESILLHEEVHQFSIKGIEIECIYEDGKHESRQITWEYHQSSFTAHLNYEASIKKNIEYIKFRVNVEGKQTSEAPFELSYRNKALVADVDAIQSFYDHFNNTANTKVLFSAPFGEGKTTFLNYFFDEHEEEYEVFRVFPVNYSVAHNEDIFRYIKTDVLFQLLGKDVEFDNEKFDHALLAQQYVISDPKKSLSSFLKIALSFSHVGTQVLKAIAVFDEIFKDYQKFQDEVEVDDRKIAEAYLKEAYEKEGSIYEDNFYTQLIRQLIDQIREQTQKKTVLIIDDLDRMDPDHIFRILNVISSHYDLKNNYLEGVHNKFGFDKIIVVCHLKNIRHVFEHRYGSKTDFSGYINKFYSSEVFQFSYQKVIDHLFRAKLERIPERNRDYVKDKLFLIRSLTLIRLLSLRELIKLLDKIIDHTTFESISKKINVEHENQPIYFRKGLFTASIYLLLKQIGSKKLFISRVEQIRELQMSFENRQLFRLVYPLLGSLATSEVKDAYDLYDVTFNKNEYRFKLIETSSSDREATEIHRNGVKYNDFTADFICELLIENIKRF